LNKLIGLCGGQGVGKTTIANIIKNENGYKIISVSSPIKKMLLSLGLSDEEVYGEKREISHPLLCGKTPRYAMRTLGTEWGREIIGKSIWFNSWIILLKYSLNKYNVIVDDIRFDLEAKAIIDLGGINLRIERDSGFYSEHISEAGISVKLIKNTIDNNKSTYNAVEEIYSIIN